MDMNMNTNMNTNTNANRSTAFACIAAATALITSSASAQHFDITITRSNGAVTTSIDTTSGLVPNRVFSADFGALGVPDFTDEPGFIAPAGTFEPGTRAGFNSLAGLRRFNGKALEPVGDERIEASFLILSSVIGSEASPGFDLAVQSDGGWHRHLNFTLFSASAKLPPSGIYVVELELYATDGVTKPSAPFWIVFNDDRSEAEHDAAIAWVEANLAGSGPPCPSDLNADGSVTAPDLSILLSAWGTGAGDINGDGTTNAIDLAALLSAWGPCP
jgi:hypothetical protein